MPQDTNDIEEPLINARARPSGEGLAAYPSDEAFGSVIRAEYEIDEGGEPLRGDVRLNQATAALAATIIGDTYTHYNYMHISEGCCIVFAV